MQTEVLLKAFEKYVERHELFSHEDKILLTVSGGVDSMVMLSIFVRLGYNIGVAHCNFGLRGKESDEDEVLVEQEARRRGVAAKIYGADKDAELSIEEWLAMFRDAEFVITDSFHGCVLSILFHKIPSTEVHHILPNYDEGSL